MAPRRSCRRDRRRRPDRPEESRLRGNCRNPPTERPLRGRRRRHPLRRLRYEPTDLDRTEFGPGGGCGKCRGGRQDHRHRGRGIVRRHHHPGLRRPLPAPRRVPHGMDRPVPLASRGHRIPLRSRYRRGHRRTSQADRHQCLGFESDPGVALVVRIPRRHECGDAGRRRRLARRDLRPSGGRADGSPEPSSWWSVGFSPHASSTWAHAVWRSSARCPGGFRPRPYRSGHW